MDKDLCLDHIDGSLMHAKSCCNWDRPANNELNAVFICSNDDLACVCEAEIEFIFDVAASIHPTTPFPPPDAVLLSLTTFDEVLLDVAADSFVAVAADGGAGLDGPATTVEFPVAFIVVIG